MSKLPRADDHYVLLLPAAEEQFLSREDLRDFLGLLLQEYPHLVDPDLQRYADPVDRAQRLMDTTCSVEVDTGQNVQWYPVRLEKRSSFS